MTKRRFPILMVRHNRNLVPMSQFDVESLERYPANRALRVQVVRDRSSPQLRLYFGALRKVADNIDQDVTEEHLHEWMKLRLGCVKVVRVGNKVLELPDSVAFDGMDQDEFNAYFDRAKVVIVEELIPGLSMRALIAEVRAMLGYDPAGADDARAAA